MGVDFVHCPSHLTSAIDLNLRVLFSCFIFQSVSEHTHSEHLLNEQTVLNIQFVFAKLFSFLKGGCSCIRACGSNGFYLCACFADL